MSLLRIKELEAQLARRDELIAELEHDLSLHRRLRPAATNIELALNFDGFDLVVRGDYTPSELEWELSAGCDEDFDITEVYLVDSVIDIAELFEDRPLAIAVLGQIRKEAAECEPEAT